ncbi:ABC transporter ATP-binding protein [Bauldia litoralis]|uniref:Peptide/nickel transport system ATP-binding protein n=1 Tax=Bauldia litoralis TaxID=665467 RepID=A0A1G6A6Y8_9HYPH|nr:oligopeptide/dipeptide ABC transporter ATP-binding protein [Bauldia litoralis]SDB04175.1 peptide/nickel transport system ATP-binding protein [Bauldia litoralis]
MTALLTVENVEKRFGGGRSLFGGAKRAVHAVQGVDIAVNKGETLGIVGESGCGKSTLARMLVGLDRPSARSIRIEGIDPSDFERGNTRVLAKKIQYVFQDPVSSLNPRKTIRTILETPMIHLLGLDKPAREARLEELMQAVKLSPEFLDRYPHEFSGGQAQRIGIARALAAGPELIILDEPVSALDVSVQAQVLNLLADLQQRFDLTYVFISHDLSVVESVSDRVAVMYFGRIVEHAEARELFRQPRHPYTKLLFDAAPVPGKRSVRGEAEPAELPDPYAPPPGCAFAPRCPNVRDRCRSERPTLAADQPSPTHAAACFFPVEA